jgi:hypothetical protein
MAKRKDAIPRENTYNSAPQPPQLALRDARKCGWTVEPSTRID